MILNCSLFCIYSIPKDVLEFKTTVGIIGVADQNFTSITGIDSFTAKERGSFTVNNGNNFTAKRK